jgi:poly-beta-1,6-N-acetyl-D-glucosamine synthase
MTPSYVLVTPARDEAQFIELTLKSVIAQTEKPIKWIIVSDGSTDGTDNIVLNYASGNPWIELVRLPERRERHFAGKVHALNTGYARIRHMDYEAVAFLDSDISFDEDYFRFLLHKLSENPALGVVGTPFKDQDGPLYDYRFVSIEHVSGACQVFRRRCFEEVGGYQPVKIGAVDHIAVATARMKGWKTRTFTEKVCRHHRKMGAAVNGPLAAWYRRGLKDYAVGNHPLWELFRSVRQVMANPPLFGSLALASGYGWALLCRRERPVSRELLVFQRREQMQRLTRFFNQWLHRRPASLDVPSSPPPEQLLHKPSGDASKIVVSCDLNQEHSPKSWLDNQSRRNGFFLVVADDWGRNREVTDRTLECWLQGSISSVSSMLFMQDSERAAKIALERNIDTGLHLNLTTAFSSPGATYRLKDHQGRISRFLLGHRLAQVMFHPGLISSFEYVVRSQLDEFFHLYGREPDRLDGHHHMHLCANVLWGRLLPPGIQVRRNFSFTRGEKSLWNRLYRYGIDGILRRNHRVLDRYFSLFPLQPGRIENILTLASGLAVEVGTHPVKVDEYQFLAGCRQFRSFLGSPGAHRIAAELHCLSSYTKERLERRDFTSIHAGLCKCFREQ